MKSNFHKISTLVLILLIGLSLPLSAQLVLKGEFRPRTEYGHGYKALAVPDMKYGLFTSQRTRFSVAFQNEKIATGLVLQDVRVWGNQSQLVANEDLATSIHEAWAEVFFNEAVSLKAGRMELAYDNQRILGSVAWVQQGRSHDLALLKIKKGINVHLGLAYNQANANYTSHTYLVGNSYKAMQFLWLNKATEKLSASLLFLNNGLQYIAPITLEESIVYSQTTGVNLDFKTGALKLNAFAYLQTGKDAANKDLSAYDASLDISYNITEPFYVGAGVELLSGTAFDEAEKNRSFTPLYGTNHKYNGFMDYFYVGNHFNNVGLNDIFLKVGFKKPTWDLGVDVHLFSASADINADASSSLGTELDFTANYKINDFSTFGFGYSQMFASESMELLKGGDRNETSNWAYLSLTVTPTFLK